MKNLKSTIIFTLLLLITHINAMSFFANKSIAKYNKEISASYKESIKEYSNLLEKKKKIKKESPNNTAQISKIKLDIEKKENQLSKIENDIHKFISFLEDLTCDETQQKNKINACIEMARIHINSKDYNSAKEYLDIVIKQNNSTENISLTKLAEAHIQKAYIYKKLIKNNSQSNLQKNKNKYLKKIAMHNERAKELFKEIIKNKSSDTSGDFKIGLNKIHLYESDMLECSLDSAVYAIKYMKHNKNIKTKKINKYKKFIKTSLEEIIDLVDKKNTKNITAEMLYCRIIATIKFAIFTIKYEPEDTKNSEQFKTKILNLFKEARDLTNKNINMLKSAYYSDAIDEILFATNDNINKLESDDL